MKFLIISHPKQPIPPEIGIQLVDAMVAWVNQHKGSGKIEDVWGFAASGGGGGILNVDSAEELDAIMVGFPFGAFSEVEAYPLVDLHESLQRLKQAMQAMAGG